MALLPILVRPITCNGNYSWILTRGFSSTKSFNRSVLLSTTLPHSKGVQAKVTGGRIINGTGRPVVESRFGYTTCNNHRQFLTGDRNRILIQLLPATRTMTSKSTPITSPANPARGHLTETSHPDLPEGEDKDKKKEAEAKAEPAAVPAKPVELSTKEKLKQAVRDYGATVIVFHITMSLSSLGFFYLLVSRFDVFNILEKMGIAGSLSISKVTEGASKFVVAYAIHKVFAPLRIAITLGVTPLIVRKLRAMGILKQAVKAATKTGS